MTPELRDASSYALATALEQAGVKLKAVLYADGYEPSVIKSPAWNTVQGQYFLSFFRPFDLPNAATEQMQSALEKYAHFSKTQFPSYSQYEAWAGADLMIKGLRVGWQEPHTSCSHQGSPRAEVLQRQRAAPNFHRLLHDLRA